MTYFLLLRYPIIFRITGQRRISGIRNQPNTNLYLTRINKNKVDNSHRSKTQQIRWSDKLTNNYKYRVSIHLIFNIIYKSEQNFAQIYPKITKLGHTCILRCNYRDASLIISCLFVLRIIIPKIKWIWQLLRTGRS